MELEKTYLPKTLIVNLAAKYGGPCSRVLSLMENLPFGSTALAALDNSDIAKRASAMGLPVFTIGDNKADPIIVSRLIRIIRKQKICILDTQNIQSKFWSSLAAAKTDTALISTLNSWYYQEHDANLRGRIYQFIERHTNWNLDLYIAVSKQILQNLIKIGVPRDLISFITNAVQIKQPPTSQNRFWLLNKIGFPAEATVYCTVGRLEKVKGYKDLIIAHSRIVSNSPSLHGIFIGEGSLYEELNWLVKKTRMEDRIKFIGFRQPNEVISIVNASDFFVMPSRSEGTPVALLEAAALGRPILATKVGGIPDLVKDGEHAILVNASDIDALAKGLMILCQNPSIAESLGQSAKQRVRKEFSLKRQIIATREAYIKAFLHSQSRKKKPQII